MTAVRTWASHSRAVRIVVTSRRLFKVSGQLALQLKQLHVPASPIDPGLEVRHPSPAVELFARRACEISGGEFSLTMENVKDVHLICQRWAACPGQSSSPPGVRRHGRCPRCWPVSTGFLTRWRPVTRMRTRSNVRCQTWWVEPRPARRGPALGHDANKRRRVWTSRNCGPRRLLMDGTVASACRVAHDASVLEVDPAGIGRGSVSGWRSGNGAPNSRSPILRPWQPGTCC